MMSKQDVLEKLRKIDKLFGSDELRSQLEAYKSLNDLIDDLESEIEVDKLIAKLDREFDKQALKLLIETDKD